MNAAINALTAPDAVSRSSTLEPGVFMDHVNLDVVNQGIYWAPKVQDQPGGNASSAQWGAEVFMAPGSRTIRRAKMSGIRFRAAILAANLPAGSNQAIVTVEAVF